MNIGRPHDMIPLSFPHIYGNVSYRASDPNRRQLHLSHMIHCPHIEWVSFKSTKSEQEIKLHEINLFCSVAAEAHLVRSAGTQMHCCCSCCGKVHRILTSTSTVEYYRPYRTSTWSSNPMWLLQFRKFALWLNAIRWRSSRSSLGQWSARMRSIWRTVHWCGRYRCDGHRWTLSNW